MIIDGKEKIVKEVIEAFDPQKKSVTWKVIEGDLLELYNYFTIIISSEDQWTTWTFVYEKKTEDIPEPLAFMGVVLDLTKDIDNHLLNIYIYIYIYIYICARTLNQNTPNKVWNCAISISNKMYEVSPTKKQ
uniref:Kirola-like n=1 Tax=Nicotiana sylvestris TaxID=4096 RepID=A0A1U7W9E0_NICSY|nr:PREDICTED: kirola-like [Nicotiana sylvestris]